jgi:phosphoribosyl 1,2-cyclic phosphodiesterase
VDSARPGSEVRVGILASGSGGNAVVVEAAGSALLFDCGLSYRQLSRRMATAGFAPTRLAAVLLSHEHDDHVKGLDVLLRHHGVPILATAGTAEGMPMRPPLEHALVVGRPVRLGAFEVVPLATSHDAREPVAWVVSHGGLRIGIATDTGIVDEALCQGLAGCHALLLECNHDRDLLRVGPYPWPLKQRILSRTGHLSNDQACAALERLVHADLEVVVGMHLSETNNRPAMVRAALKRVVAGSRVHVDVASQHEVLCVALTSGAPGKGQLALFPAPSVAPGRCSALRPRRSLLGPEG